MYPPGHGLGLAARAGAADDDPYLEHGFLSESVMLFRAPTPGRRPVGRSSSWSRGAEKHHTLGEETMLKVGIIVGSTRPGRKAEAVARWVHGIARKRTDADFEVVDIQDFNL